MNKMVTVVFNGSVLRPDVPLDLAPNTRYVVTIQELPEPSGDAWDVLEAMRELLMHPRIGLANTIIICMVHRRRQLQTIYE